MKQRYGFIAEFDAAMIRHSDIRYFGSARDDLIALTIEYRRLNQLEMMIGGYDDDPRSLYEVPEVQRWVRLIRTKWSDSLFWLTPGSLWVAVLALNPQMHRRLPDGRLQISIDPADLAPQFTASVATGAEVLRHAGLGAKDVERAISDALGTYTQMLERKQLGDYVIVHPGTGAVTEYRLEG